LIFEKVHPTRKERKAVSR